MKRITALLCLFALLLLSACARSPAPETGSEYISVYRLVREDYRTRGSLLRSELIRCNDSQPETLVRGAAYALMRIPEDDELTSAIPDSVRIEDVSLSGRTVTVLMNGSYLDLGGMDKTITDACIVLTMCSVPDVDYVAMRTANTSPLQAMSSEDILLRNTLTSESLLELRLYFPQSDGDVLSAEYRQISLDEDMPTERLIIDELIKGPQSDRLVPILPENTAVLSVYTQDGLCTVSLSEGFLSDREYSSQEIKLAVYSIVNSLTCLSTVDRVQINVRNNDRQMLGDFDISHALSRRSSITGSAVVE